MEIRTRHWPSFSVSRTLCARINRSRQFVKELGDSICRSKEENLRERNVSMIREDPRMQLTQLVAKLMVVALNQDPLLCRSSSLRKEDRGERSRRLVDVLRGSCTRSMDLLPRRNKFLSAT